MSFGKPVVLLVLLFVFFVCLLFGVGSTMKSKPDQMNSPAMNARVFTLDQDPSALVPHDTTLLSYEEHWVSLDDRMFMVTGVLYTPRLRTADDDSLAKNFQVGLLACRLSYV